MSDYIPDSPDLAVEFCPTCHPEVDIFERREDGRVWVVKYHPGGACQVSTRGSADEDTPLRGEHIWSGLTAESEACRRIQDLIR